MPFKVKKRPNPLQVALTSFLAGARQGADNPYLESALKSTIEMLKELPYRPSVQKVLSQIENEKKKEDITNISNMLGYLERYPERVKRVGLRTLYDSYISNFPSSVSKDIYGGNQYMFESLDFHPSPQPVAFAYKGRSYLPKSLNEYHPFKQALISAHEASHAIRQRKGEDPPYKKGVSWFEQPEEHRADLEAGEYLLRRMGLLGKLNPLEILSLMWGNHNVKWVENPNAPINSAMFSPTERRIREVLQKTPVFEPLSGERTYYTRKEGSHFPSFVSEEIPKDITEHWKKRAASIQNMITENPSILVYDWKEFNRNKKEPDPFTIHRGDEAKEVWVKKLITLLNQNILQKHLEGTGLGRNKKEPDKDPGLLPKLMRFKYGYPSYYKNVAIPLSKIKK